MSNINLFLYIIPISVLHFCRPCVSFCMPMLFQLTAMPSAIILASEKRSAITLAFVVSFLGWSEMPRSPVTVEPRKSSSSAQWPKKSLEKNTRCRLWSVSTRGTYLGQTFRYCNFSITILCMGASEHLSKKMQRSHRVIRRWRHNVSSIFSAVLSEIDGLPLLCSRWVSPQSM